MKRHLAITYDNAFGGRTTSTLCGRSNKQEATGFNAEVLSEHVTCAHCRAILRDPKHWRARRYLKAEAA